MEVYYDGTEIDSCMSMSDNALCVSVNPDICGPTKSATEEGSGWSTGA